MISRGEGEKNFGKAESLFLAAAGARAEHPSSYQWENSMCMGLWHACRVVLDGVEEKLGLFLPSYHLNQELLWSQCNTPFPRSCPLSARFMPGLKF